ncbi:MAG TPA: hypothetical protein VNT01_12950 [Symbiobacteriaceae bacterium]|nr:hypothetical protein [Symbiobacteriaceae bacterium]
MSDDRQVTKAELEAERRMRAQVHRWMGMSAALLTIVAVGVAIYRLNVSLAQNGAELGISMGESMKDMFAALPWVLLIIAVGVVFSMGTSRIMVGLERLWNLIRGKK